MPYPWIDAHLGAVAQSTPEDAGLTDEEKAVKEERDRGLRVPGLTPGKLPHEEGAERGMPASDPRGLVFDHESGALRPVADDDYKQPTSGKPATEKQQDAMEANTAAAQRRAAAERDK